MNTISCLRCANKNCFIQRFGTVRMMRELDEKKAQTHYKKGQYIITEGSPVIGIYFIYKGKVKVVTEGLMGKEHIVRLANNGHVIGHRGQGNEIFPIGAVAVEESVMCFIDNDTLYKIFIENPEFTYRIMMYYSEELRRVEKRIKYLSQMTVREKIAEALLYMVEIFGLNGNTLDIQLPRAEIAGLAGTNADQVSRALSELTKEGIIDTEGKYIIILEYSRLRSEVKAYDNYFLYV